MWSSRDLASPYHKHQVRRCAVDKRKKNLWSCMKTQSDQAPRRAHLCSNLWWVFRFTILCEKTERPQIRTMRSVNRQYKHKHWNLRKNEPQTKVNLLRISNPQDRKWRQMRWCKRHVRSLWASSNTFIHRLYIHTFGKIMNMLGNTEWSI